CQRVSCFSRAIRGRAPGSSAQVVVGASAEPHRSWPLARTFSTLTPPTARIPPPRRTSGRPRQAPSLARLPPTSSLSRRLPRTQLSHPARTRALSDNPLTLRQPSVVPVAFLRALLLFAMGTRLSAAKLWMSSARQSLLLPLSAWARTTSLLPIAEIRSSWPASRRFSCRPTIECQLPSGSAWPAARTPARLGKRSHSLLPL